MTTADDAALAFLAMGEVFAGSTAGGWSRVRDGAGSMVTGAPIPQLNGVVCARVGAVETAAALLDEVVATGFPYSFQSRAGDTAAEELARARGMVAGERVPFMLRDAAREAAPAAAGDDGVRRLHDDELDAHLDAMRDGFEAPEAMVAPLRGAATLSFEGVRAYVVERDGAAVATALGVVREGHVAVFNVATLPAHRGRGYGGALTERVVADGVAAGARAAFLQSSPMGVPVYERLGFRVADTWTVWLPGEPRVV